MTAPLIAPERSDFALYDHIASPIFVLELDEAGVPRYVAFNVFARAIAQRPLSDYIGKTAMDVYADAFGRTAYARHCEVARTGRPITYELELPFHNGVRVVRTTLVPDLHGPHAGRLFGSSQDITSEKETAKAQVSFDTVTAEMEQFVAMAAHDLRAPMRNIALLTGMMREDFVDRGDGKVELLDTMGEVAEKSMALIADVLAHAKATSSTGNMTTFNFAALCQDICDVLDPQLKHRFNYSPVNLRTDRTALQIGLRNIMENALKYGGRDSLNVDVTVQRGQHGMLDVILSDDGKGFGKPALDFLNGGIFRPDSGYGLFGVRRMVQARGGSLTAGNGPDGCGAVVRFSLPGTWIGETSSLGDELGQWRDKERPPVQRKRRLA